MTSFHRTPLNMGLGISSFAFAWAIGVNGYPPINPIDSNELLEIAHQLGVSHLQLADNVPVHHLPNQAWNQLLQKADQYDIQLELGIRGLKVDLIERYLTLAKACHAHFLRVVIDDIAFEPDHEEIMEIINFLLPRFRANHIVLAIENHDRFRASDIKTIIEATDPEWVGVCLDTANSLGADEGIYEVAHILAPYTVNLHIKDYSINRLAHNMGFIVEGTPAGKGQTPIPWLLELINSYERCYSATLEVWSSPLESVEATIKRERKWVEQGVDYLKPYLMS